MSYEVFRIEVAKDLQRILPEDRIPEVLSVIDNVATGFDVSKKEMALTIVGDIPEAVKYYLSAKVAQSLTERTLKEYYRTLTHFFTSVRKSVVDVETNDIRSYLFRYQQFSNNTNRTMQQKLIHLNSFFEWCVNNSILQKNPCKNVDSYKFNPKPREFAEPMELEMLRIACKNLREKAVVDLIYSSGARISELLNLEISDVDWVKRSLHIRHGKGDKDRFTYFNAEAAISLRQYLDSRDDDCPMLIVNLHGKKKHRIDRHTIETAMKELAERAQVKSEKAQPHSIRHAFATHMIRGGCPIHHVQKMLGHSNISTTMIYTTIMEDEVRQSYDRCAI